MKNLYKQFDLYTFESMMNLCCTDFQPCTVLDSEVFDAPAPCQTENRHQRLPDGF